MALPQVGQAELLAEVLATALREHAPRSVAILGCAAGNGFDRVPVDTRLVGVDLNPHYVAAARARHGARAGIELYVGDVTADELPFAPVDLAYAGLLFEYVEPAVAEHASRATGGAHARRVGGSLHIGRRRRCDRERRKRFAVQTYRRS